MRAESCGAVAFCKRCRPMISTGNKGYSLLCFVLIVLIDLLLCRLSISDGKTVVKLTEETQLILGEVTRQLNLEKLLPTYRYVVSVR